MGNPEDIQQGTNGTAVNPTNWNALVDRINYLGNKTFDVKDYGATGDGVTDDFAALQAAIDAAGVSGGVVLFPAGTYYIETNLSITSIDGVTLRGVGKDSVIVNESSLGAVLSITRADNIIVERLKLMHTRTTAQLGCISVLLANNLIVRECVIDSESGAIYLTDSLYAMIENNCIIHSDSTTIRSRYTATTGGITSGTDQLVVASASTWAVGDTIRVHGAGAAGAHLDTTVDGIAGTTFTLADDAGTTVVAEHVRHYAAGADAAYSAHRIRGNHVVLNTTDPCVEMWTGGNIIESNAIIAPALNGGTGGITLGSVIQQTVTNNYIYGFNFGIEIGNMLIPGFTGEYAEYGAATVSGNQIRSCNVGIAVSTGGLERAVSFANNHIFITDEGSWSDRDGMQIKAKYSSISGGSIVYETALDYTDTNSRGGQWGMKFDTAVIAASIKGTSFLNLDVAIRCGATSETLFLDGVFFDNVESTINTSGGSPYIYIENSRLTNCGAMVLNRMVSAKNCEFINADDNFAIDKSWGQLLSAANTYSIQENNRYVNVLSSVIQTDGNYYFQASGYGRPSIEFRDDAIEVPGNFTSWNQVNNIFDDLSLIVPYWKRILTFTTDLEFMKTPTGIVATDTAEPTAGTWEVNDSAVNSAISAKENIGWVCVSKGTEGTLNGGSTTGSITNGETALTVNSIAGLSKAAYIAIAGVTGQKKISTMIGAVGSTTVDVESTVGQKVLSVTATTNFVAGETIEIDRGGGDEEIGVIASVQAGVSLTLVDNLTNTQAITATVTNCIVIHAAADATVNGAAVSYSAAAFEQYGQTAFENDGSGNIIVGTAPNYIEFAVDGFVELHGTARATVDISFDPSNVKLPAANFPAIAEIGLTPVFLFDKTADEELRGAFEIPHEYSPGSDLQAHFHWAPVDGGAGDVTWGVEWHTTLNNNNDVLTAGTTTQIVVDATESLQDEPLLSGNVTIDGTGLVEEMTLHFRIFRDANASEGGASDTYDDDAALIRFDVEVTVDGFGVDRQY